MIRYVVMLARRSDVDRAEFRRRWIEEHGPLAAALPGLVRAELLPAVESDAPFDGVGILEFADRAALDEALASPAAAELRSHTATFADSDRAIRLVVSDDGGATFA